VPPATDGSPAPDGSNGGPDGGIDGGAADAPAALLTIDDFADGTVSPNTLGGSVSGDNQTLALVAGELSFRWNLTSVFQSFRQLLNPDSCARDLRGYRTFRFRMRASVPGKQVNVYLGRTDGACSNRTFVALGTISPTTVMTTFMIDLQTVDRENAAAFEWQPVTDATVYFIDDIQLLP
jgi:hypothetical protein